ncbi:aspartate/tyrosine/aromatic aminotransferase [Gluconacetobacter aggeris]|uniref:Aminotransferase n=1 Tax=Gluconacetobacter aggeris TaxID=1286186 RepID=A0A7W4NXA9_9PROT|nr:amino acid aminotransferase [Gluconacetobacter aggeris]MBB2169721.1 aspartate/tyrosine/aromatic aminotransferase [Gluconacetobacter aggeris]
MFAGLSHAPEDPILGMSTLFASDRDKGKIDLGIGVYKDEDGSVAVLPSVKSAERWLLETQQTKTYLSSGGNSGFTRTIQSLILGGQRMAERSRTIQTPGGSGALRLAADFLRRLRPNARVFLPDPTWANHVPIFSDAGVPVVRFPYYDEQHAKIRFDAMMDALREMRRGDLLLLHGCCHNPTGADLDSAQWGAIRDLLARSGATPFIDLAYLGFAEGLEEDAAPVRALAHGLPELLIASSCSKNFGLYRERVGALTIVATNGPDADNTLGHLLCIARSNWSMPPDHGASIVAHILSTKGLDLQWQAELATMRRRVNHMRSTLSDHLTDMGYPRFAFIARQRGMFAMLGFSREQVERLRSESHIHITGSGRFNVAGLTDANVERVAAAIAIAF